MPAKNELGTGFIQNYIYGLHDARNEWGGGHSPNQKIQRRIRQKERPIILSNHCPYVRTTRPFLGLASI